MKETSGNPPGRGNADAYIGLGANLGDAAATVAAAVEALAGLGHVAAVSRLYETDPVGVTDQPPFRNAVVLLRTARSPHELLAGLLALEARFGRERTVRWGPRTLDLDLLAYGDVTLDDADLTLPHPRAHEREFVLRPLADVAPQLALAGSTVERLLAELPAQGVRLAPEPLMRG